MEKSYLFRRQLYFIVIGGANMKKDLIKLTAGTRYVYFSSLYDEASPIYQKTGQRADAALSNIENQLHTELSVSSESNKVTTALDYLKQAAAFERTKEVQFFKNLKATHPEIEKMFNIKLDAPTNEDYIQFIIDINKALEGGEAFKKQLDTEIKRIKRNREFDKTGNYKALTYNKENNLFSEKEVASSLSEELFFLKRGRDGGKKVFEDIFSNRANESDITRIIIEQFGIKLFRFESNTLKLDTRRTNALIKILTDQAYKLIIAE